MNQNPEQLARDHIDTELIRCGWVIQNKNQINLNASTGIAIREYQTDIGPADYVLFVNKQPAGIIEAKRAEEAVYLTMHEEQTEGYRAAKLKYLNNQPLFFGYESTILLFSNPLQTSVVVCKIFVCNDDAKSQ